MFSRKLNAPKVLNVLLLCLPLVYKDRGFIASSITNLEYYLQVDCGKRYRIEKDVKKIIESRVKNFDNLSH